MTEVYDVPLVVPAVAWDGCALESNGKCVTVGERDGAGRERMRANGVRMSDATGTVGDEEGARGCGVALTIGAAAYVGKGWEKASG
jgi:hypothetical protein